jgi:hypothetical protein
MRTAAIFLAPPLAILLSGCTLFSVGGKPNAPPAGAPSPMGRGLLELRVAFHVHCHLSHDSKGRIEDIARAARNLGIDTVILNDHYEPGNIARAPRGIVHGVLFVPGVEMRLDGGGSILSAPLAADFPKRGPSSSERLAEFERQGSVNVIGHAEQVTNWDAGPFHGFEVYNLHAEFSTTSKWKILGRLFYLRADPFFEASIRHPAANLAAWDRELARGRRLAPLGGHDAHANVVVLGITLGTYPEMLRLFSTRILAREWTPQGIAEAIRAGRTFLVFDFLGDGTGFTFTYGEPGTPASDRAILGEEVEWAEGDTLGVTLPAGAAGAASRVIKDGTILLETDASRFELAAPGPGVYRVEVQTEGRTWIISAPIYLVDGASGRRQAGAGEGH